MINRLYGIAGELWHNRYVLIYYAVLVMLWGMVIGLVLDDKSVLYVALDRLIELITH